MARQKYNTTVCGKPFATKEQTIAVAWGGVILIAMLIWMMNPNKDDYKIIHVAEQQTKSVLHVPMSAEFSDSHVEKRNGGGWDVRGTVMSKNLLGVELKSMWLCPVSRIDGEYIAGEPKLVTPSTVGVQLEQALQ